jgi:hypothetical protein
MFRASTIHAREKEETAPFSMGWVLQKDERGKRIGLVHVRSFNTL